MSLSTILLILLFLFAVGAVLSVGIYSLVVGGEFSKKFSNKLMQARVALQAIALVVIMVAIYLNS